MYCSTCGQHVQDGARFCENCGAQLQLPGALTDEAPRRVVKSRSGAKPQDPYKDQIAQLRLEIKQLRLYLTQITEGMTNKRSRYYETETFVPHGLLRKIYKGIEDVQLWQPQQQKEQLQQQIRQMEQELLGLRQAQLQWKREQG